MTMPQAVESGGLPICATDAAAISICDHDRDLATIQRPETELAIWQRCLPDRLQQWLDDLAPAQLPNMRLRARPVEVRGAIPAYLDASDTPGGDSRDLLISDIDRLASRYASICGAELIDIRLEPVSNNACANFHRDCVEARLVTTYRGRGTEWVAPADADRALREQNTYQGPLQHIARGDVAMFKGSCAGQGTGIVHRSPPIAGTGETRLLLVLNKR